VHGNIYGTSFRAVRDVLKTDGRRVILDIDVQGAEQVKQSHLDSDAAYIFLSPPDLDVLEQRLRARGTESE